MDAAIASDDVSGLVKNAFKGTTGDGIHVVFGATGIVLERNLIKSVLGESADGIDTDDPVDDITVVRNKIIKTEDFFSFGIGFVRKLLGCEQLLGDLV